MFAAKRVWRRTRWEDLTIAGYRTSRWRVALARLLGYKPLPPGGQWGGPLLTCGCRLWTGVHRQRCPDPRTVLDGGVPRLKKHVTPEDPWPRGR